MGEVDNSPQVEPFEEREIQLVTLSRATEVNLNHPIVAWWYKVRHGFSSLCSALQPTMNNMIALQLVSLKRGVAFHDIASH